MKKLKLCLISVFLVFLNSCENHTKNSISDKYIIVEEEKKETSNKAQLIDYVVYKDTVYTKSILKTMLFDIYDKNKDKDVFDNFDAPTVFNIYFFTSEEILKYDKSSWICMLSKNPLDSEPRLSFNDLKIKSLQNLNDTTKSNDEIALDKLNLYLEERGLKLCSFYKQLCNLEIEFIHKADVKYPDYKFPEHGDYSKKLIEAEIKKISKNYNLADSIFLKVAVFGMGYCK